MLFKTLEPKLKLFDIEIIEIRESIRILVQNIFFFFIKSKTIFPS